MKNNLKEIRKRLGELGVYSLRDGRHHETEWRFNSFRPFGPNFKLLLTWWNIFHYFPSRCGSHKISESQTVNIIELFIHNVFFMPYYCFFVITQVNKCNWTFLFSVNSLSESKRCWFHIGRVCLRMKGSGNLKYHNKKNKNQFISCPRDSSISGYSWEAYTSKIVSFCKTISII